MEQQLQNDNHNGDIDTRERIAQNQIDEWRRVNPAFGGLNSLELSLMKMMLVAPDQYRDVQFFLICDFIDRDDAQDHVAAYYEALDLGMDTTFNVAYAFACAAANDHKNKSNRVSDLLSAMSSFKYVTNSPKDERKSGGPQRSPLSG